MRTRQAEKAVEILLVEDHPGDIRLTLEALKEIDLPNNMNVVNDGTEAILFLKRKGKYEKSPRPDIILLDLMLPRMTGHEVLAQIKSDKKFKNIPVAVLTSSQNEDDILLAYKNKVNCYIVKQPDIKELADSIQNFWGFSLLVKENLKSPV
ncbi:MAG: response regulator [Spirochaetales bacterium]|nr:response regulator [Spirochaetales bacterium]